jgi:hypothetical protein
MLKIARHSFVAMLCVSMCAPAVIGGEAAFAQKPAASKSGDKTTIAFALAAPGDVEVSIRDASGKVVRHLAAGMLGANCAPAEPLKAGLSQSVVWDGKDDNGRTVSGGPFQARVAIGLKPGFDKMIGYNPIELGTVRGLSAGPDGTLYVFSTYGGFDSGSSHGRVIALDRDGKYLRMVVPYPSNLPDEKLKTFKRIEIEPGRKVPYIYNAETRNLFPGLGGEHSMFRGAVTKDGRLLQTGVMEIFRDAGVETAQVTIVNTDGSAPAAGILGPVLSKSTRDAASLALSPDERTIYAAGQRDGPYVDKCKFVNTVYSFSLGDKEARPFISSGLNEPQSVAVDASGNVYVADKGNNRIAIFKADGSALGELKVDKPERVEVHPKNGALYVLSGDNVNVLQKFNSWKDGAAAAKATLPFFKNKYYTAVLALDASKDPAVLWVASAMGGDWGQFRLLRFEDKGTSFSAPVDIGKLPENNKPSAHRATDLALSSNRLYIWPQRGDKAPTVYDPKSGEPIANPPLPKSIFCFTAGFIFDAGRDGNYYLLSGYPSSTLTRFDAALKPLPFADGKGGEIADLGIPRTRLRGMCVDARGNAYVLHQEDKPAPGAYGDANELSEFGPDGKVIHEKLIESDIRNLNSVCTDPAGNIYIALGVHPGNEALPPFLKGKLPEGKHDPDAECGHNYYALMYGCIAKFPPKGGAIHIKGDGEAVSFAYDKTAVVKGALWMYYGASVVPGWLHSKGSPDICQCESPRFDVDGYGRSFFTDTCGFRVGVLDTAGNLICWFGNYGNQDSAGPGSAIPTPEIPLGWAQAVAVNDDAAFVGDRLNQRVVRVKLGHASEATCSLP